MAETDLLTSQQKDLIREMGEAWSYLCLAYFSNQFEIKKKAWRGYHFGENDPQRFNIEDRTSFRQYRQAGPVPVRYGSITRW